MARRRTAAAPARPQADSYVHSEAKSASRPEVGTQAQFKKKKPPATYRYDNSLSPALDWDGQNAAREEGEAQLAVASDQLSAMRQQLALLEKQLTELTAGLRKAGQAEVAKQLETVLAGNRQLTTDNLPRAAEALATLKALSRPFLNWAGKAERLSFDVPTLPLFVHERLSTEAIIETLGGHRRGDAHLQGNLFADPQRPIADQLLKAYEHADQWTNRMILGDALVVMNSLLHFENLGGQVQMIYIDPPYGVKFGSNFQPFVRKRDVKHGDDEDLTREPEMVQAYRDTWELGLHSYLTYLRDRLLLARDLLHPSGSVFVQISDENLHHVREVMDEVFGAENFVSLISFATTTGFESSAVPRAGDYAIWYSRDREHVKYRPLYVSSEREIGTDGYRWIQLNDGETRSLTAAEVRGEEPIPTGARVYIPDNLISQGAASEPQPYTFRGKTYLPPANSHWKASCPDGMDRLAKAKRLHVSQNSLRYIRFADDFPWRDLNNLWTDTLTGQFTEAKSYVVQTNTKVLQRCLLMTTDPGDLVLDPTCGSGTTAYVAEQWGRRWLTIDVSRVPLALARQRLLTATFPWYELKQPERGPAGGFVYKRKQNSKGEEVGGIVPHVTLKSIANNEPPAEEVLVDRPEQDKSITRVTGPFCFEAMIPTAQDLAEADLKSAASVPGDEDPATFTQRMIEVLRRSPILHLGGNKKANLKNIRPPAKTLCLSAEAVIVNGEEKPVAILFGPENAGVSERTVQEALREANLKGYGQLFVIGFGITANARMLLQQAESMGLPRAIYVEATRDLLMGDLLKNMRSSQIFSVCGLPEVKVTSTGKNGQKRHQVELLGLDVFDPTTMEVDSKAADNVPAWFLDTDYNGLCFHVCQAFFPRTAAWDNLKKELKGLYDDAVWDHLAGTKSAPFEAGDHKQVAVKVIDDRGNELLVVKGIK